MIAAVLAVLLLAATAQPVSWLDKATPVNWNTGGSVPAAPASDAAADLKKGGRCAGTIRAPRFPEDRAVAAKGWFLIGPYQNYGATTTLMGATGADGMCRPLGYQGFVFVNGAFAGTIAPRPMDSRTDGSVSTLGATVYNAKSIEALFSRYADADPLCCPHATVTVEYEIRRVAGRSVLVPTSTTVQKLPQQ